MAGEGQKRGSLASAMKELILGLDYRAPRSVTELVVYHNGLEEIGYYLCPRCETTLDREFVRYCDRCGQRLDWRDYTEVIVRYAGTGS